MENPLIMANSCTLHHVFHTPLDADFEASGFRLALFGLGCFWGAERRFWQIGASRGVVSTAVGYAGGSSENPTYDAVCSGGTGHAEVVRVVYDPKLMDYERLLQVFWSAHDPTVRNPKSDGDGWQYRSVVFVYDEAQREAAEASKAEKEREMREKYEGVVLTEVREAPMFWFGEEYHQQYFAKMWS